MDPIHPILPHEPRIPEVAAPPPYGRLTRDQRREREPQRRRREDHDRDDPEPGTGGYDDELAAADYEAELAESRAHPPDGPGDDDGAGPGLHIDITA